MKKTLCFIIAILLFFFSADTVFAEETMDHIDSVDTPEGVDNVPPPGDMEFDQDMIGSDSDQSLTSLPDNLQTDKDKKRQAAIMKIEEIQRLQDEMKKVQGYLNIAWQYVGEAESENKEIEMPSEIAEYMKANGLGYDSIGNDLFLNSEEWKKVRQLLQDHQEKLGSDTSEKMKAIQDNMENIDPYRWQENRADSNQTNSGPARGQSMYGDSEAGLAVTGLVVGFFLGCVITLAVQKSRGKKDKA